MRKTAITLLTLAVLLCSCGKKQPVRLLYWNILNGMWDGQIDNYDRFVDWVSSQNPDICVWCEAQSIHKTQSEEAMPVNERYLTEGWKELAARYGHEYIYEACHRDNYPQVITSKYPIENVERIGGSEPDSVVCHGAGWATIEINGKTLNIVTLHTWPQGYRPGAGDLQKSIEANEGDRYRKLEMEYICKHTILTHKKTDNELWLMMGDHNAVSRVDNYHYNYPEDSPVFLLHDYIHENTDYVDVIAEKHPGEFISTLPSRYGEKRIDFIYANPNMFKNISRAEVIYDKYTTPTFDSLTTFAHPSDHMPIEIDFKL